MKCARCALRRPVAGRHLAAYASDSDRYASRSVARRRMPQYMRASRSGVRYASPNVRA